MMAEVISLHGSSYETDISELSVVDYCEEVIAECDFVDHGITDEQVLLWYSNLPTNQQQYLRKLFKDGADLKLGSSTFHMDFSMEPAGLAIM